jgi:N-acetyltransferase
MSNSNFVLRGRLIRLEQLKHDHVDGLVSAAAADPALYKWSRVPQGKRQAQEYVETAVAWKAAGTALPFAIVREDDGRVLGSTRFWNLERWAWPAGHVRHGREQPDVCEIGYTWLAHDSIRTGVNTESKLLMLTYAFETWRVLRVCFHTDARNERSRAALERLGAKFEGVLGAHRMAADFIARDSFRFSIVASEWPAVKSHICSLLDRRSQLRG